MKFLIFPGTSSKQKNLIIALYGGSVEKFSARPRLQIQF